MRGTTGDRWIPRFPYKEPVMHYNDVITSAMVSQITSLTIVYSTVYSRCLCEGNSPVTGEFPAQRASNVENVSIWWRHHDGKHFHIMMSQCSFSGSHPLRRQCGRPEWLPCGPPVREDRATTRLATYAGGGYRQQHTLLYNAILSWFLPGILAFSTGILVTMG